MSGEQLGSTASKIAAGIVLMLVTSFFTYLLTSSKENAAAAADLASVKERQKEIAQRVLVIEQSLANGGPPALAQRVDKLEQSLEKMEGQLGDVYRVVVLRQPPSAR